MCSRCWTERDERDTPGYEPFRTTRRLTDSYSVDIDTDAGANPQACKQGKYASPNTLDREGGVVGDEEDRLVIHCQTKGVSAAQATHCATY